MRYGLGSSNDALVAFDIDRHTAKLRILLMANWPWLFSLHLEAKSRMSSRTSLLVNKFRSY